MICRGGEIPLELLEPLSALPLQSLPFRSSWKGISLIDHWWTADRFRLGWDSSAPGRSLRLHVGLLCRSYSLLSCDRIVCCFLSTDSRIIVYWILYFSVLISYFWISYWCPVFHEFLMIPTAFDSEMLLWPGVNVVFNRQGTSMSCISCWDSRSSGVGQVCVNCWRKETSCTEHVY